MQRLRDTPITEFHASPWVLPNENIVSWLKWNDDSNVKKIIIKADAELVFHEFFNIDMEKRQTKEIEVIVDELETPGFFGFSAFYNKVPSYELEIELTAKLFSDTKIIQTVKKKIRITRPIILL